MTHRKNLVWTSDTGQTEAEVSGTEVTFRCSRYERLRMLGIKILWEALLNIFISVNEILLIQAPRRREANSSVCLTLEQEKKNKDLQKGIALVISSCCFLAPRRLDRWQQNGLLGLHGLLRRNAKWSWSRSCSITSESITLRPGGSHMSLEQHLWLHSKLKARSSAAAHVCQARASF